MTKRIHMLFSGIGGCYMFFYKVTCLFCKKEFKLYDNDPQYQKYKRNMQGKFSCPTCKERIESDARKMRF